MDSLIIIFFSIFNQKNAQYQKMNSLRMLQMELDPNFFQKPNISDCLILKISKPTSRGLLILKILQKLEPDVNKIKNCSTISLNPTTTNTHQQPTFNLLQQYYISLNCLESIIQTLW